MASLLPAVSPRSARGYGSQRLNPLFGGSQAMRPQTSFVPSSAQLRGGGRLYTNSPLDGYSEAEMIAEAKLRMEHNKQRQRLKKLLHAASNGDSVVKTDDLLLACQLAKMPMDKAAVQNTPFAVDRYGEGSPRSIAWKRFHQNIEYPNLHGAGAFGQVRLRKQDQVATAMIGPNMNQVSGTIQDDVVVGDGGNLKLVASDQEVYDNWLKLKNLIATRFSEIRRAFRLIDEDSSGDCDKKEIKFMLNAMFNLSVPDHVMDRLIDLADFDGDGVINFAEFARIMTADNVLKMKKTVVADPGNWGRESPEKILTLDYSDLAEMKRKMQSGGYETKDHHVKLRRTGPGIDALRRAHSTYKKAILGRYSSMKEAFRAIDTDGSGLIRRAELRRFLRGLSKSIPDRVISGLIDFCDSDGDAKTLNLKEFNDMMSAELLGAGGYDPSHIYSKPEE